MGKTIYGKEWVALAEGLTEKHNGILPNSIWLQSHKYYGLDKTIKENPELFEHINGRQIIKPLTRFELMDFS